MKIRLIGVLVFSVSILQAAQPPINVTTTQGQVLAGIQAPSLAQVVCRNNTTRPIRDIPVGGIVNKFTRFVPNQLGQPQQFLDGTPEQVCSVEGLTAELAFQVPTPNIFFFRPPPTATTPIP